MFASSGHGPRFGFDNSYQRLPDRFYARLAPTPVASPRLVKLNLQLAELLGVDPAALSSQAGVAVLSGNEIPEGAEPIAMAYAGHQFGGFSPQLGDGRAILLGEVVGKDGVRRDIQLKGSGPTPFSRRGDGRAALGPVLREYIVSEAMFALSIPTTRSLAAVATGEPVRRETMLPGAVLTRVAESHIRVGTFQYFAARGDIEALRQLTDHVVARLYPDVAGAERPVLALVERVIARQASLIAAWLHVGFIHGVMNTDNMSISGETIDYGPCAFMDTFRPDTVYSSIDQAGRYAYGNQPAIAQWNLARFAETLLPLIDPDEQKAVELASAAVDRFAVHFVTAYAAGMRRKLGFLTAQKHDLEIANELLAVMAASAADFTNTFAQLSDAVIGGEAEERYRSSFSDQAAIGRWMDTWRGRLAEEPGTAEQRQEMMRSANPLFIPRNHLVEEVISAAVERNDYEPFETIVAILSRPFEEQPGSERFRLPPRPEEIVRETFCGT